MHTDFASFGLPAKLQHALARMQFKTPTPIQALAIPFALEGKDVLGSAQTGTGKTGAFGIPIIAKLMAEPLSAALIMTPTRELATQVMASIAQMIPVPEIKTALLIGGESMPKQLRQLQARPRLIVGTPGRINDHLTRGSLRLSNVRFLVLDETDRMLDMGFGIQIEQIVKHIPAERQTMLFSATLPSNIVKLSSKYLKLPERVAVGSTTTPSVEIKQELIQTSEADKYTQLLAQLQAREGSVIIFVKTKFGTERLAERLNRADYKSDAIHGDLQQRRRDRVIQGFRDKQFRILVATDVAARGLDIPHIEHVINYDLPQCPEDYIHRIGRTARAGAKGEAVNLITPADQVKWRAIHKLISGDDNYVSGAGVGGRGGRSGGGGRSSGGPKRSGPPRRSGGGKPGGARPFGDRDRPRSTTASERTERSDRPRSAAAASARPASDRPVSAKPASARPFSDRPVSAKPASARPFGDRPRSATANDRPTGKSTAAGAKKFGPRVSDGAKGSSRPAAGGSAKPSWKSSAPSKGRGKPQGGRSKSAA